MEAMHIVALSGGKDSSAMALRLAEIEPRDYTYLITPTGNELAEMTDHWARLECMLGKPLVRVSKHTLEGMIQIQKCLPSNRIRWCTRILKIEPAIAWMAAHAAGGTLYVGLRADEPERQGLFNQTVQTDFPMRRWGWGEAEVWDYLDARGVRIPYRTDCAWCYDQRLSQWRRLWQTNRELYNRAIEYEDMIGQTFRNPHRDNWPAGLRELAAEFAKGRIPRGADDQMDLFDEAIQGRCRVCSM